jgi:hypothetical protein
MRIARNGIVQNLAYRLGEAASWGRAHNFASYRL